MKYRRELVIVCLLTAFAGSVLYDTRLIIMFGAWRGVVAAAVVACFGAIFLLTRYPRNVIQPALLAAWPLHLFTICFLGISYCFHGSSQLGAIIAYTVVGYSVYLLLPLCFLLDRQLCETFVKIVAVGSALLAIPSYIGALGIDSIAGIPLSNKYFYSQFSGLIASGGIFEHPEGQALQMAIGLFCSFHALRQTRDPLYAVCLAMVVAGLVLSQGRGAIFGVVIAVGIGLLPAWFCRSPLFFIGTLVFCLLFPFLIWQQIGRIPGVADYLRIERGLSGRDSAWPFALSLVEQRPWTGHGFGSSGELSETGKKQLQESGYSGVGTTFHNTFITKAVELGLIGAFSYSLLYFFPLMRICKTSPFVSQQSLIRSIIILSVTVSVFRDYNIGGVRSTSMLVALFLGLANLWPLASEFARWSQAADDQSPDLDLLLASGDVPFESASSSQQQGGAK